MANCRKCGADIVWGVSNKGKYIPLNSSPVDINELEDDAVVWCDADEKFMGIKEARQRTGDAEFFVNHWPSCDGFK